MYTYRIVTNLIVGGVVRVRCADVSASDSHTAVQIALNGGGKTVTFREDALGNPPFRANYPAPRIK